MTIKEFAYAAQRHLQSKTDSVFKRSHVYELLAAAFGFDSYAALGCNAVLTLRHSDAPPSSKNGHLIRRRCLALGYPPTTADAISNELPGFVANRQLDVVGYSDLVAVLREESWRWGDDQHWVEPDDDMPVQTWSVLDGDEISAILVDSLESAASNGSALAHYALALIYAPGEDDEPEVGSSYWYSQEQQGRVLTGVEKEWADAHAQRLRTEELYAHHLREAARLGCAEALLDLADRFDDPAFFENAQRSVMEDPAKVAEIATRLGRRKDAKRWLTVAAEAGDTEAMRQLIEGHCRDDLGQCWMWVYLARLLGTDLMRDEYYAIHEDGTPYDDDVGGPAFVDGRDGVKLDPLDAERDAAARTAAEQRFKDFDLTE
jgi:TPR repeat protein